MAAIQTSWQLYPLCMLLRLWVLATMLSLLALGAKRKRLKVGPVSMVYYDLAARRRPRRRRSAATSPAGEPWVLLHGLGSVAATWGPTLVSLSRECRLLVPELSALGGTQAPGGGLTVRLGADMVARLIDQELAGRPVTLVGLSLGGWIAVRLALARPDLVSRLVLVDAAGYRAQDWERISRQITLVDLSEVDRLYATLYSRTPFVMRLSRKGFLRSFTSPGVRTILRDTAEADTFNDRDLARLAMPVALVWAEHDRLFPLAVARAMAAAIPHARLEVVPDCGHAVHIERPSALRAAIERVRRELPLRLPGAAAGASPMTAASGNASAAECTDPSDPGALDGAA